MDWLDLAVEGTLKSLLPHHISKASILWRSAFFIVQVSHPYMTTGKRLQSMGLQRVGWGCKDSDTIERLTLSCFHIHAMNYFIATKNNHLHANITS